MEIRTKFGPFVAVVGDAIEGVDIEKGKDYFASLGFVETTGMIHFKEVGNDVALTDAELEWIDKIVKAEDRLIREYENECAVNADETRTEKALGLL